jgi:hypothetical protein
LVNGPLKLPDLLPQVSCKDFNGSRGKKFERNEKFRPNYPLGRKGCNPIRLVGGWVKWRSENEIAPASAASATRKPINELVQSSLRAVSRAWLRPVLEQSMFDRLLNSALWLTVMALITFTAGTALILVYRGLFNLCIGRYPSGGAAVGVSIVFAAASYILARNGNDLMDR